MANPGSQAGSVGVPGQAIYPLCFIAFSCETWLILQALGVLWGLINSGRALWTGRCPLCTFYPGTSTNCTSKAGPIYLCFPDQVIRQETLKPCPKSFTELGGGGPEETSGTLASNLATTTETRFVLKKGSINAQCLCHLVPSLGSPSRAGLDFPELTLCWPTKRRPLLIRKEMWVSGRRWRITRLQNVYHRQVDWRFLLALVSLLKDLTREVLLCREKESLFIFFNCIWNLF